MNLIEVNISNKDIIRKIALLHMDAYKEKFSDDIISNNIKDYIEETRNDVIKKRVFTNDDVDRIIVCEDRTDRLIKNSTYHLVTRIYVKPELRGVGAAKGLIKYCQEKLGVLMGYDGKFYTIGEVK